MDIIKGIHLMYVDNNRILDSSKTFTGIKAKLLSEAARKYEEYYACPEDRHIVLLGTSDKADTFTFHCCTSSDELYDAEEIANDWIAVGNSTANEYVREHTNYASIVDTVKCKEIFYETSC